MRIRFSLERTCGDFDGLRRVARELNMRDGVPLVGVSRTQLKRLAVSLLAGVFFLQAGPERRRET